MDKSHKNSFTTKRQILFNSEFEFCALVCIMPTDKVTGCARLIRNSEFRCPLTRTNLNNFDRYNAGRKIISRPVYFIVNLLK